MQVGEENYISVSEISNGKKKDIMNDCCNGRHLTEIRDKMMMRMLIRKKEGRCLLFFMIFRISLTFDNCAEM